MADHCSDSVEVRLRRQVEVLKRPFTYLRYRVEAVTQSTSGLYYWAPPLDNGRRHMASP